MARTGFFPPPSALHREKQKSRSAPSSASAAGLRLRVDPPPVHRSPSRPRRSRPENQTGEYTMATIGTFTKTDTGFTGSVKTLTLNVKATFRADDKENDKAPDFRILAGATDYVE
jgi:hypothetical protein